MNYSLGGFLTAIVLSGAAQAATFNVTRMDDPVPDGCQVNNCSLREAVIDADQTVAKDTIVLPAGVYLIDFAGGVDTSVESGDLDISTDMDFIGAPSTIDGQNLGRMMEIKSGATVALMDLTLRNANSSLATNNTQNGGALQISGGTLIVDSVTFSDNSTQSLGGAIYARDDAVLDIDNSFFTNNSAGRGAAIMSSGKVTVRNTTFNGNQGIEGTLDNGAVAYLSGSTNDSLFENVVFDQNVTTGSGGAIYFLGSKLRIDGLVATSNQSTTRGGGVIFVPGTNHAKQVEIVNALFKSNMAQDGGAISYSADSDTLDIRHSSFVGNVAGGDGGALYQTGNNVDLTNVTFSGNQVTNNGGAIYLFGEGLTLLHSTFSGGSATRGNALYVGGSVGISSAQLANNLIDGGCDISNADTVTSLGGNVEGTGDSCELSAGSDLVNQSNALLGLQPLRNNIGGTPTHELTSASVARGQGETTICESVKVDQLYESRGSNCNSGAVESNTIFKDGFESGLTKS